MFLGGIINYVLAHEKYFRDYVLNYTNAATLADRGLRRHRGPGRVFSGLDREHRHLRLRDLALPGRRVSAAAGAATPAKARRGPRRPARRDAPGRARRGARLGQRRAHRIRTDETLQHPRCVFQVLNRHFARYTPEMVEQACGVPPDAFAAGVPS